MIYNSNIEQISILYKNELELKDNEIESLSKDLYELNKKINDEKNKKKLLILENKKIKEIYSSFNNYNSKKKENEKIEDNKNDLNKKNKIIKNEIKNKIILKSCNFYNKINEIVNGNKKYLIKKDKLTIDDINNNINLLYELETKFHLIENNIFNNK